MNIKISPFSSDRVLDRIPWLMIRDGPCNSAISKWGLCFAGPTHVHHSGICGQNYLKIKSLMGDYHIYMYVLRNPYLNC